MQKRILAFLCVLTLSFSMTSMTAVAATTYVPTSIPKSFPIIKQDPTFTVVNFWHAMTGNNAIYVSNITNWYNSTLGKKNKIYVKAIFEGAYADITTKIQATLQSGNVKALPDLIQLNSAGAFSVKECKSILYMQDMMDADKTFKVKDNLNKNALQACSYKGKQLGMPFSNSMIALHYNADAFKAAGLDPANPPKTLAEFASYAQKLLIKGTGKKPVRFGASIRPAAYQFSTWIPRQKGGTAYQFDQEDGRTGVPTKYMAMDDGTLKTTLSAWKTTSDTGAVEYTNSAPRVNFQYGYNAMYVESMVNFDSIELDFASYKDKSKIFNHMMARMPGVNADDAIGEAIGGSAVYMFNKGDDKSKASAWDFVKFLASADVSAYWYVSSGYYPLNSDALNTKYVADCWAKYPNKKAMIQVRADSAKAYKFQEPWVPSYYAYDNILIDQCAMLSQGKITVDQAAATITKKAANILKIYWDANK